MNRTEVPRLDTPYPRGTGTLGNCMPEHTAGQAVSPYHTRGHSLEPGHSSVVCGSVLSLWSRARKLQGGGPHSSPPQGGWAASRCADVGKGAVASAVRAESDSGSLHCLLLHHSCSFDISRQAGQGKHREPAQRPTTPTLVSSEKFYRKGCTSFSSTLTKRPQEAGDDLQGPFHGDFHFQGPSRNWSHMN